MSTWLLIEVDDIADVGKDEKRRFLIERKPQIDCWVGTIGCDIKCVGESVHPAIKKD